MNRKTVILALASALLVPGVPPPAAEPESDTINITAADVQDREMDLMEETKKRLASTARELRREAQDVPGALNTARYTATYEEFQEELRRARRRPWWKKTEAVEIPRVPPPGSAGYAALERQREETRRRRAAAAQQAREQVHEQLMEENRLAVQQAILAEERRQSDLMQAQLLEDLYDDYDSQTLYFLSSRTFRHRPFLHSPRVAPRFGPGAPPPARLNKSPGSPR